MRSHGRGSEPGLSLGLISALACKEAPEFRATPSRPAERRSTHKRCGERRGEGGGAGNMCVRAWAALWTA